jgi:molecular chaperone DnaJ
MTAQREWFEKDYYKVLGVAESATDKEITRAYRKLAKEHHPDANPGSEDRFKEISAAYDVLGDSAKRKEYDEVRRMGPMAGGFGAPGGAGGFGGGFDPGTFRTEDMGDLSDLFGGLFGGGRRRRPRGPQRGGDLEAGLHLAFADAIQGVTTSVNLPSDVACSTCRGSGAAPGTSLKTCGRCEGSGQLDDNQGMFSLSSVCPNCQGRGQVVETPCSSCHGTGREKSTRQVKVRIPAGVEDGQRIRVKGRGAPGQGTAPAGDLYVIVHVGHDDRFTRRGRNLTTVTRISFPEAALGTQVTVPTLDGPVTLKVAPGTASGSMLRVRGRGVPATSGKRPQAAGDLLVKVEVDVPKSMTEEQRAAVEAMGRAFGVFESTDDGAAGDTEERAEEEVGS